MWKQFIVNWNGASFFLSSALEDSTCLNLHTDASGALGYGGFFKGKWFQGKWFQGKWEPYQRLGQPEISIAWQELFAIVVAYHIWGGGSLEHKRIKKKLRRREHNFILPQVKTERFKRSYVNRCLFNYFN